MTHKLSPRRHRHFPHLKLKRKSCLSFRAEANLATIRELPTSLPFGNAYCLLVASTTRNEMVCDAYVANREPRRANNRLGPYRNLQDSERSNKSPSGNNPRKHESTKKEREILTNQPAEKQAKTPSITPNPMTNNTQNTTQNAQITRDKDWCSIQTKGVTTEHPHFRRHSTPLSYPC
jgi:hypothetical protein